MRLIALSGRAGSGKDTVARMIPGAVLVSFADPLKRFCAEVFDFSEAQLWGPSEERNRPDPRYTRADGQPLTPRHALQTLGTEWGRACFPDVWAVAGVRRARSLAAECVVFTDCRFTNEARAVRDAGGEVWRIVRPGTGLAGAGALHPSEVEMEGPEFRALVTREILNNGSLAALRAYVLGSGI